MCLWLSFFSIDKKVIKVLLEAGADLYMKDMVTKKESQIKTIVSLILFFCDSKYATILVAFFVFVFTFTHLYICILMQNAI
jgi:hypothetical protein